jgi:hypothetical protein
VPESGEKVALFAFHLFAFGNWFAAVAAAWQGRWWLAAWCLLAAVLLSLGLVLYGAIREANKR